MTGYALLPFAFFIRYFRGKNPFLVMAALGWAAVLSPFFVHGAELPRLEKVPCWFTVTEPMRVRCARMHVAQVRGTSPAREIDFPVVIFESTAKERKSDAVLIPGGGGPGNAMGLTQNRIEGLWRMHDWILASGRDAVLMDPRGVGLARPTLACREFTAIVPQLWSRHNTAVEELALTLQALQACKTRLQGEGIDLNAYHTDAMVADIEELRRALDIPQWNIYGTSYGANLAYAVAQTYPDRVRSVILDSFQPPDVRFFDRYAQTVSRAFTSLFELCRSDTGCVRDYPNLDKIVARLVEQADAQPLRLTVAHPYTLEPFPMVVSGLSLLAVLRSALYSEDDVGALPEIIYAVARGSTDLLAPLLRNTLEEDLDEAYSDGVHFSTNCREEVPFNNMQAAMRQAQRQPLAAEFMLSVLEYYQAVCTLWDVAPAPVAGTQTAQINVPALILAGALDPVTPAQWSMQSPGKFRRVVRREFAGVGHDVIAGTYCAVIVAESFLDDPERAALDPDCLKESRPLRFRLLPRH